MIESKELIQYTKGLSLLFVEDDDELRNNTAEIVKNFFQDVDVASHGAEALELYQDKLDNYKKAYDIVLTDIRMPKMDGIKLIEKIYDLNDTQSVIVLSAHDTSSYLLPLINLGIEQFVQKPIDFQELLKALLKTSQKVIQRDTKKQQEESLIVYLTNDAIYDRENSSLHINKKKVYLTKYEIIFMQLLTQKTERIFSNEDIVTNYTVKGEKMDAQNIRKLVSKLRKKLPKETLESVYGIGYRIATNL